jgi:predicted nuclease of restriction endonuclease-like (RecB) superfamily
VFPEIKIVSALMTQLSWTHLLSIIPIDDPLKRDFYAEMCRIKCWNTRTLVKKIQSTLLERLSHGSEILSQARLEREID